MPKLFWLSVFVSSALCKHLAHMQISHYRLRTRLVHQDFPFLSGAKRAGPTSALARRMSVTDIWYLGAWAKRPEKIRRPPDAKQRVPLGKMMADTVKGRALAPPVATVPPVEQQSARIVNAKEKICPKTVFVESRFGDSENAQEQKLRDPDDPRDVKSWR